MAGRKTLRLTLDEARGVMLAAQGLLEPPAPAPGIDEVRATVDRLGVVQVDTISVVRRAQYLALWSRLGPYDAAALDTLLYPGRATFEYWSHAASIVPMADYRYYRPDMLAFATNLYPSDTEWMRVNPRRAAADAGDHSRAGAAGLQRLRAARRWPPRRSVGLVRAEGEPARAARALDHRRADDPQPARGAAGLRSARARARRGLRPRTQRQATARPDRAAALLRAHARCARWAW